MATRRSRIKAVANLPARRNRPVGSVGVKKEDFESTETTDFSSTSEIGESLPSVKKVERSLVDGSQLDTKGLQESSISSCDSSQTALSSDNVKTTSREDTATSDEPQLAPDRRSVIVSVDKDRKSVIVNRDDCISPSNSLPKDSSCKNDSEKAHTNSQTKFKKQLEDNLEKQPVKAHGGKGQVIVSSVDTNTSAESKVSPSTEDSTIISNKRLPLRNRRSKPTVNLTAATRKRSANDIAVSPCSPPPVKLKSAEPPLGRVSDELTAVTKSDDAPNQSLASDTNGVSLSENAINSLSLSPSPVTAPRPLDNVNGVFKTPLAPVSKNKDVSNDSTNKGDVTPVSPQKESSNVKRKPSTNAQRVATARKNLKSRIDTDGTPPRSALTMFDLIFYNPSKNPMKSNGTPLNKSRRRSSSVSSIVSIHEDRLNEESVDDIDEVDEALNNPEDTVEETAMPVPQVKVGPDGSLILDEQSLVIETTGAKKNREELEKSEVIIDSGTGYGHYKKIVRSKDWSDHETKKFYRALNVVGTDFSLMKPYFRSRTRRELKLKFKKEEKLNPNLITKALADPLDFDISELEKECELEDEDEKRLEEAAKEKAGEKLKEKTENALDKTKRPAGKKKKQCIPLAEIGLETGNSSADGTSTLRKKAKKRRAVLSDEDDKEVTSLEIGLETENGSPAETICKKAKQKKQKPVDPAEEDYNMLAMGLDMPSKQVCPKKEKTTEEQEEMGIFAEPKTVPDTQQNSCKKEPSVKRIQRKAPNLPQKLASDGKTSKTSKKPASDSNTSKTLQKPASDSKTSKTLQKPASGGNSPLVLSGSNTPVVLSSSNTPLVLSDIGFLQAARLDFGCPQTSVVQSSEEANLKVSSTILTSKTAVVHSTEQSQIGTTSTLPETITSTSGFKLIQSSTQSRIQVVHASSQSVLPTTGFEVVQSSPKSQVQIVQSSPQSRMQIAQSSPQPRAQLVQSSPPSRAQLVQSSPQSRMQLVQSSPQSRVQLVQSSQPGVKLFQSSPQPRVQIVQSSPQSQVQLVQSSQSGVKLFQSSPQPRVQIVQSSPQSQVQLVQSSPQSRVQLVQSSQPGVKLVQSSRVQPVQGSPQTTPPPMTSIGSVTPRTYNIIRKPVSGVRPLSTPENTVLPINTLVTSFSSNSTCLVSSPGGKFVRSSPQMRVTPESSPNVAGFGSTTPVSRLLPSTPLPRMEPGSIIVLKTPLPQNPDRHVLQVYMVTNTPPGSTANALPHSPGMNLLSGPSVQPANLKSPPCMSDDSDCEKVLTTL